MIPHEELASSALGKDEVGSSNLPSSSRIPKSKGFGIFVCVFFELPTSSGAKHVKSEVRGPRETLVSWGDVGGSNPPSSSKSFDFKSELFLFCHLEKVIATTLDKQGEV